MIQRHRGRHLTERSADTDEEQVRASLAAFAAAGADEAICFPTAPDPDQVKPLARAAGR